MAKTIKEIAAECKVSEQAIRGGVGETMLRKMRKEVSQLAKAKNASYIYTIWG